MEMIPGQEQNPDLAQLSEQYADAFADYVEAQREVAAMLRDDGTTADDVAAAHDMLGEHAVRLKKMRDELLRLRGDMS